MHEINKKRIADAADMIVNGFAFKRDGDTLKIVNLNKKQPHVLIISISGKVLESSMDPIEQSIALDIWEKDAECMEEVNA